MEKGQNEQTKHAYQADTGPKQHTDGMPAAQVKHDDSKGNAQYADEHPSGDTAIFRDVDLMFLEIQGGEDGELLVPMLKQEYRRPFGFHELVEVVHGNLKHRFDLAFQIE